MNFTHRLRSLVRLACIALVAIQAARVAVARELAPARMQPSAPLEGPDPQFKNAFTKLMAKKDKAEMAKLVKSQVPDAVDWIVYTCEQISVQSSDELETFMAELREAWSTAMKSDFAEREYKYFSTVSGANKKDRVELKKRFDKNNDDLEANKTRKDNFAFQNIVDEFELLAGAFDQVGDMYYSSQAWLAVAACWDEPLRGSNADLYKACSAYTRALEARDRIDLKDPTYEEANKRKIALVGKGYDKKKETPPAQPQEPSGPAAPAAAAPTTVPMSFEIVPTVDQFLRPTYENDEIYEMWPALALKAKGTSATFYNLQGAPPLFRMASADLRWDTNGDGVGDEKLTLTGNIAPVKLAIGKEEQRPWAFLCVTGAQKDNYQGLEVNLAPDDRQMQIFYCAAASIVGTVGATPVRVIDESVDALYGNPPVTWHYEGLSKDNFEPVMDSIVIGGSKRARPWSEFQEIDGKWYKLAIAPNGKEMSVAAVTVDTGILKLDYKGPAPTWLVVHGAGDRDKCYFDLVEGGAKGVSVPTGKYTLFFGDVRKGKKKQTQKALILPGKGTATYNVAKGQTTLVTLGAPYGFDFSTTYTGEKLTVEGASVVITGSAGERYERTWNCVPKPEVEWRQKGSKLAKKGGKMLGLVDTDSINKLGWAAAWSPRDITIDCKGGGDKVEAQLVDKRHELFGAITSEWRE